ncbi:ATP-binding protein [Streptomyces chartreusis]|uniref:ATP-binding protein n=1 Tax=Streptomyces chartreusis TaxID=1969 RepID=UPI003813AF24
MPAIPTVRRVAVEEATAWVVRPSRGCDHDAHQHRHPFSGDPVHCPLHARSAGTTQIVAAGVHVPPPRGATDSPEPRLVVDAEWRLEHRPEAVGRARRLARALLAGWKTPQDEAEAAVLVVSELVTNAVEHAEPPLVLHLHRQHADRRVWIGVTDGGPAAQDGAWSSSCAPDERGRGLHLVQALAQAHGMRRHAGGITYWVRMAA